MTYSEVFEAMGKPLGELLEELRQASQPEPQQEEPAEDYNEIINLIFEDHGRN